MAIWESPPLPRPQRKIRPRFPISSIPTAGLKKAQFRRGPLLLLNPRSFRQRGWYCLEPDGKARKEILLRVPEELKDWIDEQAEVRDWSRNLFLCEVLKAVRREKNLEVGFNT